MFDLKFGDNLLSLRHQKGLTQEDIASFIGVTKGSVSKWENKQSLPDITLLPSLAVLLDVTVDELLGYETQLTKQQITKIYTHFSEQFAVKDYQIVFKDVGDIVRKYYNCYPFLQQMCILMLNHYSLWNTPEEQKEVLEECKKWCVHIQTSCKDFDLIVEAASVQTLIDLCLGNYEDVIAYLNKALDPTKISNFLHSNLIQAYQMAGDLDSMEKYAQFFIYQSMAQMMTFSIMMLSAKMQDRAWCEETIHRLDSLVDSYRIRTLNANIAVQYFYQVAINQIFYGNKESALHYLEEFADAAITLMHKPEQITKGDEYFNRIADWFTELPLGSSLPRNMKLVSSDLLAILDNPMFQSLSGEERFERMKKRVKKEASLCRK